MAAAIIAALVIVLGGTVPASAATPEEARVVSAAVLARGAAVQVRFEVTCTPAFFNQLAVTLTQPGRSTTSARVTVQGCTGGPQPVSVVFVPAPGARAFGPGAGTVTGGLGRCDRASDCTSTPISQAVRLLTWVSPFPAQEGPDPVMAVSATRNALGSSVRVALDVTCPGGSGITLYGYFLQRVGAITTQANAAPTIDCRGTKQRVTLVFPRASGQPAFTNGSAYVETVIVRCDSEPCARSESRDVVRVVTTRT